MFSPYYSNRCSYQHAELVLSLGLRTVLPAGFAFDVFHSADLQEYMHLSAWGLLDIEPKAAMITSINYLCILLHHVSPTFRGPTIGPSNLSKQPWVKTRPMLNWPQEKHIGFNGLKTARRFMFLIPETLFGLLLMPGALCSVFGPQGIQLRGGDLFQDPPVSKPNFRVECFSSSLVGVG